MDSLDTVADYYWLLNTCSLYHVKGWPRDLLKGCKFVPLLQSWANVTTCYKPLNVRVQSMWPSWLNSSSAFRETRYVETLGRGNYQSLRGRHIWRWDPASWLIQEGNILGHGKDRPIEPDHTYAPSPFPTPPQPPPPPPPPYSTNWWLSSCSCGCLTSRPLSETKETDTTNITTWATFWYSYEAAIHKNS